MKKLALAGIVSIFATVALSGCMSVPEEDVTPAEGDTTPVVEETTEPTEEVTAEMNTYEGTSVPLKFEYPSNMHIEQSDRELPHGGYYINLGEEYTESGYPLTLVRIAIEKDDYQEVMVEAEWDGPFFPIENKCENEQWAETVWNCETEGDWANYLAQTKMGDIGFEKTYFMDKEVEGWTKVEVRVDLLSDDLVAGFGEAESILELMKDYELDEEQLRRIELVDALVASMTLK